MNGDTRVPSCEVSDRSDPSGDEEIEDDAAARASLWESAGCRPGASHPMREPVSASGMRVPVLKQGRQVVWEAIALGRVLVGEWVLAFAARSEGNQWQ